MCGIVGYFDKSGRPDVSVGRAVLRMLNALAGRGPDSSGAALWGDAGRGLVVRVKAGGRGPELIERARRVGRVASHARQGELVRLEISKTEPVELAAALEEIDPAVEVVSIGHRLEIVKQVGAPPHLESEFGISRMRASHALGHTRLSTESRVDLSHSQPFWAHGTVDLAIVHNGHITNYHRLRRLYEQDGVRFYTENDSEIIGVYLARQLADGLSFREALAASIDDLDGSFSYLAATADAFGFAKDAFCLKPLIVAESDEAVAIANEEIAIRAARGGADEAREAGAGAVAVWERPHPAGRRRVRQRVS